MNHQSAIEGLAEVAGDRSRLNNHESAVLALLNRRPKESYRRYVMRIAQVHGEPGRIARTIKLADLDDHLRQRGVAPEHRTTRGRSGR